MAFYFAIFWGNLITRQRKKLSLYTIYSYIIRITKVDQAVYVCRKKQRYVYKISWTNTLLMIGLCDQFCVSCGKFFRCSLNSDIFEKVLTRLLKRVANIFDLQTARLKLNYPLYRLLLKTPDKGCAEPEVLSFHYLIHFILAFVEWIFFTMKEEWRAERNTTRR